MILWNFNPFSLFLFIILLLIWSILLRLIYFKQKNKISVIFLFISVIFLLINIFEIKWWYKNSTENIEWGKIVFVVDVSSSMDVQDIKDNRTFFSRLWSSKEVIKKYITKYINNNYGLMIFAWETMEVLPFTNDIDIYNTVLFWINNTNISKLWTNLDSVFSSLENYFVSEKEWWLVIIFSDLWEEEINIDKEQLNLLKNKWIKILLIWVGSDNWWKIPIWKDFFWENVYKVYNWQEIISKLNTSELKRISNQYNLDYIIFDNMNNFDDISDYITDNINLIDLENSTYNRNDLTRLFIFLSFMSFILFLYTENFIWKRK
jgi:hypothetical protein